MYYVIRSDNGKWVAGDNKADAHKEAKCRDGSACTGPGCNVSTGKTARKQGR